MTPEIVNDTRQGRGGHHLTRWIAAFELLLTFALIDAAIILRSAHLMTDPQLFACAAAYVLIAAGTLVTAHQMARS